MHGLQKLVGTPGSAGGLHRNTGWNVNGQANTSARTCKQSETKLSQSKKSRRCVKADFKSCCGRVAGADVSQGAREDGSESDGGRR